MLDLENYNFITEVSKLCKKSKSVVVSVILASRIVAERKQNGRTETGTSKSNNVGPSKKQRVAKRRRSR